MQYFMVDLKTKNFIYGKYQITRAVWSIPSTFCVNFQYAIDGVEQEFGLRMDMDKRCFLDDLPDPDADAMLKEHRIEMWEAIIDWVCAVRIAHEKPQPLPDWRLAVRNTDEDPLPSAS